MSSVTSRTSPKMKPPFGAPDTSTVTVGSWVQFGAMVKVDGSTVTVTSGSAVVTAVYVAAVSATLRTVRVKVHTSPHDRLTMDGTFRVFGSPPVAGLAARKFS